MKHFIQAVGVTELSPGACRIWRRFRPEGPWELSPGFSLGGVTI